MKYFNFKLFFVSVIFVCSGIAINAQVLIEAKPENAGMSAQKLELLDDFIQKYVDDNKVPGGVFLVARKGNIVYNKSFGSRNDKNETYKQNDIFRIASMTKAVTTVAIMQLYEQGKLGLNEAVQKYIPAFKDQQVIDSFDKTDSSYTTVPVKRPVTIRNLLTHTSGISYGGFNPGKIQIIYNKFNLNEFGLSHPTLSTEEMANKIAKAPLVFQPGEKFMYGLNMDVLGRVIEVVSGIGLDEYFRLNIFEPLGMEDTYFYLPEGKHARLVPVYNQTKEGFKLAEEKSEFGGLNYPKAQELINFAGGGGLSSTALDYARFIQALVNNGNYNGIRLLGRKTIEIMTSDQMIKLNSKGTGFSKNPGETFCLGFSLLTEDARGKNSKSVGTYEWGGYFNTKFFIDPREELIFVGMTQIVPFYHGDFWNKMYAIIYGAIND
jgi:CubicO group peptidase (beta-lactamase class C family)